VFTLGMGALPPRLYSHGSSMLGTFQQVAAAFGTALVVTVMSGRATSLIADGVAKVPAEVSGLRLAFVVVAALSLLTVVIALRLPNRLPPTEVNAPVTGPEETVVAGPGRSAS
jgi:MFS transporter, DHA2 family, lincomycin resistance protein